MKFVNLSNEIEEVIKLINESFNKNALIDNFKLMDNQKLLLLKDNNIVVGVTLITLKKDPFRNTKTYYLDYVCIKDAYRNQGLGRKMLDKIEEDAKKSGINYIELTSSKERVNARKMYTSFGMNIKDTDLFIKEVK